ncbi:MAG TPA: restriction endonuclease subunit S, partial [Bacillales bacterium]|nr:restriction endonuclease subunit S [Bacillales bacterium]
FSYLSQGSAQANFGPSYLKQMYYPIPPLEEQNKTAEILISVDENIEKTEAVIEQTENVKKGLMRKLLTEGIGHSAFKHTEIGKIPAQWKVVKVEDVCEILDGLRKPIKKAERDHIHGDVPYYGASGIIDWVNDYLFDEPLILLAEDGENLRSRVLPVAFQIKGKAWVNNHAHILRPGKHINMDYLELYLDFIDYEKYITGSAQPKLNQKAARNILIAYPEMKEQIKIATAFSRIKNKLNKEQETLAKLRTLKKGLMQVLLTGKVRVNMNEKAGKAAEVK